MIKAVILFIALCFVASIAAAPQGSVCDTCQIVVTQLENYVNQTEPEIEKQLVKACAQLPPQIEGLCDTIVLVYGHQIIQALLKKETPQVVCQQIRLCPKNTTVAEKPAMPNDLQCTLCKLLVQAAESYISQNKTSQQILDGLHKVCDALPSFWKDQCKALVDQYTPQIIEYLKQKYPAEVICQKISLCKAAAEHEPKVAVTNDYCEMCHQIAQYVEDYIQDNRTSAKIIEALTKVCNYTGQYEAMCKAMLPVVWSQLVKKILDQEPPAVICKQLHLCAAKKVVAAPKVSNAQLCNGCKYLVAVADNFITKNSTEQHIVQTVEKVCEYFPASYKGICHAVVEQYGPQIIEQLVQKVLDPTKVCTAVKACPKQAPKAEEVVAAHGFKIKMN